MSNQDKKAEIEFSAKQAAVRGSENFLARERRQRELQLVGLNGLRSQVILEAGCGTGPYGLELARQENLVIGVDISPELVKIAQNWANVNKLSFYSVLGDIEELPLKNESVDVCFCGFIMHHLPEVRNPFREFYRIIKPGGTLALIEPNGSNPVLKFSNVFRRTFLLSLCNEMGVCSANEKDYPYKHYYRALQECGFDNIQGSSHHVLNMGSHEQKEQGTLKNRFLQFLLEAREVSFSVSARVLPQPYKWPDLYVTARKSRGDKT